MKKYWKYLKYVVVHKWWVMIACFKFGLYWRGLTHDISKLLPSEFVPYAKYFYGKRSRAVQQNKVAYIHKPGIDEQFDIAWLEHQKRNKHHWQWWMLPLDDGGIKLLEMNDIDMLEMLCDWWGAGKAQKSQLSTKQWFQINTAKIRLNDKTQRKVEIILGVVSINAELNTLYEVALGQLKFDFLQKSRT